MKSLVCNAVATCLLLSVFSCGEPAGVVGDPGSDFDYCSSTGNYYKYVSGDYGWYEACSKASEYSGGHLVTVNSVAEQEWLNATYSGVPLARYWIGYTDRAEEGSWEWITGETSSYVNWCEGQPDGNSDYAWCGFDGDYWDDYPESGENIGYIIEIEAK